MRPYWLFVLVLCVSVSLTLALRTPRKTRAALQKSENDVTIDVIKKMQRESKERRLLKKKKQRLRELREEIRVLSRSSHAIDPTAAISTLAAKPKDRDGRWRKKILEKMKVILKRLDRMERRTPTVVIKHKVTQRPSPLQLQTTTPMIRTSITTPIESASKMKRIQSSIEQARSGDNGTACASHKDCRPGRCCQLSSVPSPSAQCSFFSLSEGQPCVDSCQCENRLHCYRHNHNDTRAFCKSAVSDDVRHGVYLNNKDAVLAEKRKRKK